MSKGAGAAVEDGCLRGSLSDLRERWVPEATGHSQDVGTGRRERLILQPGRLRQPERGHVWLETFMAGWDTELLAGALQIPADSC